MKPVQKREYSRNMRLSLAEYVSSNLLYRINMGILQTDGSTAQGDLGAHQVYNRPDLLADSNRSSTFGAYMASTASADNSRNRCIDRPDIVKTVINND